MVLAVSAFARCKPADSWLVVGSSVHEPTPSRSHDYESGRVWLTGFFESIHA